MEYAVYIIEHTLIIVNTPKVKTRCDIVIRLLKQHAYTVSDTNFKFAADL